MSVEHVKRILCQALFHAGVSVKDVEARAESLIRDFPWMVVAEPELLYDQNQQPNLSNPIKDAAEALVRRLDEINANPSFNGVFSMALAHGYKYTGPSFAKPLEDLKRALGYSISVAVAPLPGAATVPELEQALVDAAQEADDAMASWCSAEWNGHPIHLKLRRAIGDYLNRVRKVQAPKPTVCPECKTEIKGSRCTGVCRLDGFHEFYRTVDQLTETNNRRMADAQAYTVTMLQDQVNELRRALDAAHQTFAAEVQALQQQLVNQAKQTPGVRAWEFVENYLARAVVADAETRNIILDTHMLDPQVSLACKLLTDAHNKEVAAVLSMVKP